MTIDVLKELERAGAVLLDHHFVYVSGKHGSGYINIDPLFPDVALVSQLCEKLVEPYVGSVDAVVAPATGGIVLSVLSARALLDKGDVVSSVWADKTGDRDFAFERAGFADAVKGKRVLVVEDLLTTGFSVEKVSRLVERHGGEIAGVSVVVNRGSVTAASLDVPRLDALVSVEFEATEADRCPLCAAETPIVEDIGHGGEFRAQHPEYQGGYMKLLDHPSEN